MKLAINILIKNPHRSIKLLRIDPGEADQNLFPTKVPGFEIIEIKTVMLGPFVISDEWRENLPSL